MTLHRRCRTASMAALRLLNLPRRQHVRLPQCSRVNRLCPCLVTVSDRARFGAGTAAAANLRLRPRHVLQFGRVLSYGPPGQHRWSELDAVDSLGLRREYCLLANLELGPLPR